MSGNFDIHGPYPGVVGEVTRLHAVYYFEHWGFDLSFETQVGGELSSFLAGFEPGRDGFWAATREGGFAGSVAVDGSRAQTEGARLRWFIVDPGLQGTGLGRALLQKALDFCDRQGFPRVVLWTFAGLDPARKLYDSAGFRLVEEYEADQWGAIIREQKFERLLGGREPA